MGLKQWREEGVEVDWEKLLPPKGFPRSCLVGGGADVLLDGAQPTDELMDYERLTATSEAFIYVAMSRLMVKRLARS